MTCERCKYSNLLNQTFGGSVLTRRVTQRGGLNRSLVAPGVAYWLLLCGTFSQVGLRFRDRREAHVVSNKGLHRSDGARGGARPFGGRGGRAVGHLSLQLVHSLLQLRALRQQLLVALMNRFLAKKPPQKTKSSTSIMEHVCMECTQFPLKTLTSGLKHETGFLTHLRSHARVPADVVANPQLQVT